MTTDTLTARELADADTTTLDMLAWHGRTDQIKAAARDERRRRSTASARLLCRCGYSIPATSRRRSHCGERMADVSPEAVRALRAITALEGFPVDGDVRTAADWIIAGKAAPDNTGAGLAALDELVAVAEGRKP